MPFLNIVLDIIAVCILVFFTVSGYKKGFIKSLYVLCSIVFVFIIMMFLNNIFYDYISQTDYAKYLHSSVEKNVSENIYKKTQKEPKANSKEVLAQSGVPSILSDFINNDVQKAVDNGTMSVAKATGKVVADMTVKVLSGILLFVILFILLRIILMILNAIFKLPLLNVANKGMGLVIGAAKGLLVLYLLCLALNVVIPLSKDKALLKAVDDTIVVKYFYQNNIFMRVFV